MLHSVLTNYSSGTDISVLLEKIDCKLATLGNSLYGNTVFMLNDPVSATAIIDLLNYKRILTFRQVNPDYCSNLDMLTGEMIGDVIQWNQSNLIYGNSTNSIFWFNKIIKNGISSDTLFPDILVPPLMITTISVYNVIASGFQLIIQTTDGNELLNEYINASQFLILTLNTPISSLLGINVTSPSWNGAIINLSISTENPF